jgi:hypothetical protein
MYNINMDIKGPAFVIMKDGKTLNKFEIITTKKTLGGYQNTCYYFNNKNDAELYLRFLQQIAGRRFIEETLSSRRTPNWEKKEFREFEESIDWDEIPAKVKNIKFTTISNFVEIRARK